MKIKVLSLLALSALAVALCFSAVTPASEVARTGSHSRGEPATCGRASRHG